MRRWREEIADLHADRRASALNLLHSFFGWGALVGPLLSGALTESPAIGTATEAINALPLPEAVDGDRYRKALSIALQRVVDFKPLFLVVSIGFDTAKGDPTGTWSLTPRDFEANGRLLGGLGLPILVVQEGGYLTRMLGPCARAFFEGLAEGSADVAGGPTATRTSSPPRADG